MAIEKMRLVRIAFAPDQLGTVLVHLSKTKDFHPEPAVSLSNEGNGGVPMAPDVTYDQYLNRIVSAANTLRCNLNDQAPIPETLSNQEIEQHIADVEGRIQAIREKHLDTSSLKDEDRAALEKLREYDIEKLNSLKYLNVHLGRFPNSSIPKLALHNSDRFIYDVLNKNNHYHWLLYVNLKEDEQALSEMFASLFFEPMQLPMIDEDVVANACSLELNEVYGYVREQVRLYELVRYVSIFGDQRVIGGFVPTRMLKQLRKCFAGVDVMIDDFPPELEEGLTPPTLLRSNWLFAPFELFLSMYGIPKYGTFDPTWFLAITYCLLYGLMFSDLGQGIVLLVVGLYFEKKKHSQLGAIIARVAPFSMVFGILFSSVFGNETLLDPMWHALGFAEKPITVMDPSFINTLLLIAIAIGVFLILISIFYNIIEKFREHQLGDALFDQNGVAGFVFYGSLIGGAALLMLKGINLFSPLMIILTIALPLLLILFKQPLTNLTQKRAMRPEAGWGGYLVESIFELFEVCLSFLSNTMSYLRVGGFVLSHAGMMLVVSTLTEQAGHLGFLVAVIGNLFVIVLEGMIVGIQTLRLEYYEMFSRYYSGGGKKFVPVEVIRQRIGGN